jgi:hypothetical protein
VCITSVHAAPLYTISPLIIDTKAVPRDIIKKSITITNTGTQPVTLYPTVNNISLKEGGTIDEFLSQVESDKSKSLASWIEISRQGIDLAIGASKTVDLTLRISPSAVTGTFHAFVGFGYGRNRDEAEIQVKNGQAPGSMVTVTIDEKKNVVLKLSKFVVDRFITQPDNNAAMYIFTNPGDETLVPKGDIIIYNGKGEEVGHLTVNDENIAIAPGQEHVFTATLPMKGLFGKYKAFLSVEYGDKKQGSVQDTSFFYVFPVKAIMTIFAIVIVLAGCAAWFVHKRYFGDDEEEDESARLTFHVRDALSEARHHDIDLTKKQ